MIMANAMRGFLAGVLLLAALVSWALVALAGFPLGAALLASVLLAVALHASVVAAGSLLAWGMGRRAGVRTGPGWLRAWPGEVAISLRNMYVDIPWRHRWPRRVPAKSKGVVLLVHGYGCNRGVWRGMDTWLMSQGWTVEAVDLEPPYASIDEFGRQVARAARDLARETGVARVFVVAHSMGGLSSRAALRADPAGPIAHVITVATPHQGTFHARLGRGICSSEMIPGCVWLTDLLGAEPAGLAERFTCIASVHDNIVSPASVALLPGAASLVIEKVGHMRLLFQPQVRTLIAERLERLVETP